MIPSQYQPPLPLDTLLIKQASEGAGDSMELDVLFVGAGPAGLAGAIELARLAKADAAVGELNIGVLEKAEALGEHSLSGAVVNPVALRSGIDEAVRLGERVEVFAKRGSVVLLGVEAELMGREVTELPG